MKTHFKIQSGIFKRRATLPLIALAMLACGHLGDRTTVVYGKVYDLSQQPVDSIMVQLTGSNLSISEVELESGYTDENGQYELLVEVPGKYHNVTVDVPYFPDQNPKFHNNYKISKRIGNSSKPMIGHKTQWDFQLEPK